jgi:hypothetical protein
VTPISTPRASRYRFKGHDGALIDIPGARGRGYFVKTSDIDALIDGLCRVIETIEADEQQHDDAA